MDMERDSQPQPGPSPHDPMDAADGFFERHRCCCFPWPKSTWDWERIQLASDRAPPPSPTPTSARWWSPGVAAFMKIREWSELVAGPRWKTFIRRFNRNARFGLAPTAARFGSARFQYDPLSYAMNFDEGHGASPEAEGDYTGYRDFSTRFAVLPGSAKSSMDLGGRDAAPLFQVPVQDVS
ncbi:NHL domain protein [Rhynchospora pubera]|uniref:NHL domain protein n=1 Tax=Rhynchospora pubera TaxID=906938 RepID=A0AAV8D0V0_9POAL|nr:NHL domain protein [Rhynchospora pubera]